MSNEQREGGGMGLNKAIAAIKATLAGGGGIQKGRQAPMGYAFRGIEDFDNILCGLTAQHGVNIYPRVTRREIIHGKTAKGTYQAHVILDVEFKFVHLDGSYEIAATCGEAMDTQDKAHNKAMQAARKYAIVQVFQIPVGGDDTEVYVPENAPHQEPAKDASPQQAAPLPPPAQAAPPAEKRTRGPNKPKDEPPAPPAQEPAQQAAPAGEPELPFPHGPAGVTTNDIDGLVDRIGAVSTFPLLFAIAQDAEESTKGGPDRPGVFAAIRTRAIHLFDAAKSMKEVQEGFEIVTALGQPPDVAAAANKAYAKYRTTAARS